MENLANLAPIVKWTRRVNGIPEWWIVLIVWHCVRPVITVMFEGLQHLDLVDQVVIILELPHVHVCQTHSGGLAIGFVPWLRWLIA